MGVPGVGLIAIVKNAQIVFPGEGIRKLGEPARVDEKTIFARLASKHHCRGLGMLMTKAAQRDDPAAKYLPGFQLVGRMPSRYDRA